MGDAFIASLLAIQPQQPGVGNNAPVFNNKKYSSHSHIFADYLYRLQMVTESLKPQNLSINRQPSRAQYRQAFEQLSIQTGIVNPESLFQDVISNQALNYAFKRLVDSFFHQRHLIKIHHTRKKKSPQMQTF